jgi:hypothetical protein
VDLDPLMRLLVFDRRMQGMIRIHMDIRQGLGGMHRFRSKNGDALSWQCCGAYFRVWHPRLRCNS